MSEDNNKPTFVLGRWNIYFDFQQHWYFEKWPDCYNGCKIFWVGPFLFERLEGRCREAHKEFSE